MRKLIGAILVMTALGLLLLPRAKSESEAKENLNKMREEIDASEAGNESHATPESEVEFTTEPVDDEAEENPVEVTEESEPELFPWIDTLEDEDELGIISVTSKDGQEILSCALGYGGTTKESLHGFARIHSDLSDTKHLFCLAHNNEQYYSSNLFTNLKKASVGDIVVMEFKDGSVLQFCIEEILPWIAEEEYAENNYEICTQSDLTLATCAWVNGTKGRLVVRCSLVTEEQ